MLRGRGRGLGLYQRYTYLAKNKGHIFVLLFFLLQFDKNDITYEARTLNTQNIETVKKPSTGSFTKSYERITF